MHSPNKINIDRTFTLTAPTYREIFLAQKTQHAKRGLGMSQGKGPINVYIITSVRTGLGSTRNTKYNTLSLKCIFDSGSIIFKSGINFFEHSSNQIFFRFEIHHFEIFLKIRLPGTDFTALRIFGLFS